MSLSTFYVRRENKRVTKKGRTKKQEKVSKSEALKFVSRYSHPPAEINEVIVLAIFGIISRTSSKLWN